MGHDIRRSRLVVRYMLLLGFTPFALWGCGGSGGPSGGGTSATSVRVVFPSQQTSLEPGDIPVNPTPHLGYQKTTMANLLDDLQGFYRVGVVYAQTIPGAPANVASLKLFITGPGMSPRENIDMSTGSVTVDVPVGNDRLFEVRAFPTGSSIPNFIGQTRASVSSSGTNVIVSMQAVNLHPPIANAGPNQTVRVTETVQLNGSGSSDVDGDPLTF